MIDWRAHAEGALAWVFRLIGQLDSDLRKDRKPRAVILAYHRVLPDGDLSTFPFFEDILTPLSSFSAQMDLLARRCSVLPLEALIGMLRRGESPPGRTVCITFDDGYADNYAHAFPILALRRLPATVFLATGYLGGARGLFWWDEVCRWSGAGRRFVEVPGLGRRAVATRAGRDGVLEELKQRPLDEILEAVRAVSAQLGLSPPREAGKEFLTWDQVREMQRSGISFGAHTRSHCLLPRETAARRQEEILQSRADVERETGRSCTLFCYPNGSADDASIQAVRDAGFEGSVLGRPGDVAAGADPFRLPRKIMNYRASSTVFRFRLSPHPEMIKQAITKPWRRSA